MIKLINIIAITNMKMNKTIFHLKNKSSAISSNSFQEEKKQSKKMSNKAVLGYHKVLSDYQLPMNEILQDEEAKIVKSEYINSKIRMKVDNLVLKKKSNICLKKLIPISDQTEQFKESGHNYQNTDYFSLPIIKTTTKLSHQHVAFSIFDQENENKADTGTINKSKKIHKVKTFSKIYMGMNTVVNHTNKEIEEMRTLKVSNIRLSFNKYSNAITSSSSSTGHIKAYAVNSYQGIVRSYHEDRVSIILTIAQPKEYKGIWPQCSFFSIFDGHGGNKCCDFLRDKLQDYVIKNCFFPTNPKMALYSGIEKAEKDFTSLYALDKSSQLIDKSGSCAIVALIVNDICYVANVGDSRMIISKNKGRVLSIITTDHKPDEEGEAKRIEANGGTLYQGHLTKFPILSQFEVNIPYRVHPGGLAVSRTIGDVEAKIPSLGGKPNVVIATPEITQFKIDEDTDFFVMGSDGIFDFLSNEECVECAWITMKSKKYSQSIHSKAGAVVDMIMKSALKRKTMDNISSIFVAFNSFEKSYQKRFGNKEKLLDKTSQSLTKSTMMEVKPSSLVSKHSLIKLKLKAPMAVSS